MVVMKLKKPKKRKSTVILNHPTKIILKRVNFLFFVIFVLFLSLIAKLYNMQIMNKSFYDKKTVTSGSVTKVTEGSVRGQIFDAKGIALVSNKTLQTINFTRSPAMTAEQMRGIALKLVNIIQEPVETDTLTTRDKKDFFLADPKNLSGVRERLKKSDYVDPKTGEKLPEGEIYAKYVDKVSDDEILYDTETERAATFYKRMNGTSNFTTNIITSGEFTAEQLAKIAENERNLKGIAIGNTWNREYSDSTLNSINNICTIWTGRPDNFF